MDQIEILAAEVDGNLIFRKLKNEKRRGISKPRNVTSKRIKIHLYFGNLEIYIHHFYFLLQAIVKSMRRMREPMKTNLNFKYELLISLIK